ncbi:MAG: hypothetical protein KGH53_01970 [Candidatus Micrarchaeota archaeon]|nr:hypothetical protein [Candidatus Micrarchaeota archaeon]
MAIRVPLFFFLLSLILTANVYHAQLGQAAGAFVINMSIGSTATRNWSLVNTGDIPLAYRVILPTFTPIPNATAPTVVAVPMNGTIAPHTTVAVKVVITLPYLNNKAGIRWDSVIGSVAQPLNFTQGTGGAQIQGGVGKEIVIKSQPATIDPLALAAIIAGIVIAIALGIYYYKYKFLPKYNSKEERAKRAKRQKEIAKEKLRRMEEKLRSERAKLLAEARMIGKQASMAEKAAKSTASKKSAKRSPRKQKKGAKKK